MYIFFVMILVSLNTAYATDSIPKCAGNTAILEAIKQISTPKEIVIVSQGYVSNGGKTLVGYIFLEGSECKPRLILTKGAEFTDISGYKPTGAEPCSTNETIIKSEQLIVNANRKLNNWKPKGTMFNNTNHYLKRWNFEGKACSDLSESKIGGCTGSCKSMMDDPSFHGKANFCKMVLKVDTACYKNCCK